MTDPFPDWYAALETRHRERLTFPEVRHALQALSSLYVERRERIQGGAALDGAGKRAAFALYYGPLHFLLVREIVRALGAAAPAPRTLLDWGCGTGAAGAAWALECSPTPAVEALDRSTWAAGEARWTLGHLGLRARVSTGDLLRSPLPRGTAALLLAFTANEVDDAARAAILRRLIEAGGQGTRVLVVEPLSRRVTPFWPDWEKAFLAAGGRADEWRFRLPLPASLRLLDKAAGLDHRELTGRSLYLPGPLK